MIIKGINLKIMNEIGHLVQDLEHFEAINPFFSSPEPKAPRELIVWDSSRRLSICMCIRGSTLSNMNISEISWRIIIKFRFDHH